MSRDAALSGRSEQPEPFRCAAAARERADPQLGSAPQARRWLLIEHRGPWPLDAPGGSGISAPVIEMLSRAARAQAARPLLIRRPGRTDSAAALSWAVVYDDEGCSQWGRWDTDDDLTAAAAALGLPRPGPETSNDAILLVCAHGLRDVCCAIRGRPVAAALAQRWPEATWECSHVGGDRFAANLVVLPDGVYYGNLDSDSAVQVVEAHLRGTVPLHYLRGMSRVAPPAQVAIAAAHQRFGPFGARDVEVLAVEHLSPGLWQVELAIPGREHGTIRATVASTRRAPARLTCRAEADTPAAEYRVLDLR